MTTQPNDRQNFLIGNQLRLTAHPSVEMPTGRQLTQMYAACTPITKAQYDGLINLLPADTRPAEGEEGSTYFYLWRGPRPFHVSHGNKPEGKPESVKSKPFLSVNRLNLTKGTYETIFVRPGGTTFADFKEFYERNRKSGMFFSALSELIAGGAAVRCLSNGPPKKKEQQPQKPRPPKTATDLKVYTPKPKPPQKPATHTLGSHWPAEAKFDDINPGAVVVNDFERSSPESNEHLNQVIYSSHEGPAPESYPPRSPEELAAEMEERIAFAKGHVEAEEVSAAIDAVLPIAGKMADIVNVATLPSCQDAVIAPIGVARGEVTVINLDDKGREVEQYDSAESSLVDVSDTRVDVSDSSN